MIIRHTSAIAIAILLSSVNSSAQQAVEPATLQFELPPLELSAIIGAACGGLAYATKGREIGRLTVHYGELTCMVNFLGDDSMNGLRSAFGLGEKASATKHIVYKIAPSAEGSTVRLRKRLSVLDFTADPRSYSIDLPMGNSASKLDEYVKARVHIRPPLKSDQ